MVLAILLAATIWPADAQVKIRKVDATVEMRSVSIVRRCPGPENAHEELRFEYPHYRGRDAATRSINGAIERSFHVERELADCPIPDPIWAGDIAYGVSVTCDSGARHGSLLSIQCTRGWESGGRTGGYDDFMLFDTTSGRGLQTTDLIGDIPRFKRLIWQQLHETYSEDLGDDAEDEAVAELIGDLSKNCGVAKARLSCSALMGMHNYFDVSFELRSLCEVFRGQWFAADCAAPER